MVPYVFTTACKNLSQSALPNVYITNARRVNRVPGQCFFHTSIEAKGVRRGSMLRSRLHSKRWNCFAYARVMPEQEDNWALVEILVSISMNFSNHKEHHVFPRLDVKGYHNISRCCKRWSSLVNHPDFWQDMGICVIRSSSHVLLVTSLTSFLPDLNLSETIEIVLSPSNMLFFLGDDITQAERKTYYLKMEYRLIVCFFFIHAQVRDGAFFDQRPFVQSLKFFFF